VLSFFMNHRPLFPVDLCPSLRSHTLPLTLLESTLMDPLVSVENKELTERLSPAESTLTKAIIYLTQWRGRAHYCGEEEVANEIWRKRIPHLTI
jgi:hypothetical protein